MIIEQATIELPLTVLLLVVHHKITHEASLYELHALPR